MANYTDYTNGQVLTAANLNDKLVTPINDIGGDDLEDGIVTALAGPAVQFTIGAEAANVIQVTVQIEQVDGTDITQEGFFGNVWLADSAGGGESTSGPTTDFSVSTGTLIGTQSALKHLFVESDATGTLILDIEDTGTPTFYLRVAIGGRVSTSAAITFA